MDLVWVDLVWVRLSELQKVNGLWSTLVYLERALFDSAFKASPEAEDKRNSLRWGHWPRSEALVGAPDLWRKPKKGVE